MEKIDRKYLDPTAIIDCDNNLIIDYAMDTIGRSKDPVEQAVKLYNKVRDDIWYDPYYPFYLPEHYQASNVLKSGRGYCVAKASLLCALGRALEIPSRVGFADVRNHLATTQLIEHLGTDLFVFHGFTEFCLAGKWVKATPAFNKELCERHKVPPLEFNGREDSIFHPYNLEKKKYMEYVAFHETYHDIPVDKIVAVWEESYGRDRVRKWIENSENAKGKPVSDFFGEDILDK